MTKWELFNSLVNRIAIVLKYNGKQLAVGIVNTIQAEDGSGHSFNVQIAGNTKTFYLRTID